MKNTLELMQHKRAQGFQPAMYAKITRTKSFQANFGNKEIGMSGNFFVMESAAYSKWTVNTHWSIDPKKRRKVAHITVFMHDFCRALQQNIISWWPGEERVEWTLCCICFSKRPISLQTRVYQSWSRSRNACFQLFCTYWQSWKMFYIWGISAIYLT